MSAAAAAKKDYFIAVNPYLSTIIIIGLFGFIQCMALRPDWLLYLGPFGSLLATFATTYPNAVWQFYIVCMVIHSAEGIIGFVMAAFYRQLNLLSIAKWTLSSFLFGYLSLKHLFFIQTKKEH